MQELRSAVIVNETAAEENKELRKLLDYRDGERFPDDYRGVATRVFVRPQTVFRQDVLIAAGSSDGIRPEDPSFVPRASSAPSPRSRRTRPRSGS